MSNFVQWWRLRFAHTPKPIRVLVWPAPVSGGAMCAVFDAKGQQIPLLQGNWQEKKEAIRRRNPQARVERAVDDLDASWKSQSGHSLYPGVDGPIRW